MSIVVDYTKRIAPDALRAADVVGVCRYLSPLIDSTAWKRITLDEYRELVNANIKVTLNWEYDARDWLHGRNGGLNDASRACQQAEWLGYPKGRVIVGSADFDMKLSDWNAVGEPYCRAFADTCRTMGYRPGVYGPWDVLQWVRSIGAMDAFWQAGMSTAWSGGRNAKLWPGAQLYQRGQRSIAGQTVDWNQIIIDDWGKPMDPVLASWLAALCWRGDAVAYGLDTVRGGPSQGEGMWLVTVLKTLLSKVDLSPEELAAIEEAANRGASAGAEWTPEDVTALAHQLAAETDANAIEAMLTAFASRLRVTVAPEG